MNRNVLRVGMAVGAAGVVTTTVMVATAQGDRVGGHRGGDTVTAKLTGYDEDPAVVSSTGEGRFKARISKSERSVTYTLRYADLEGTATQSHLHFGRPAQSGGISVFLCSNLGNGPAGTQACPTEGRISGTITAENVIGPAAQGIAAGEFAELLKAIKAEAIYVNLHSTLYPGGEIRGQVD